MQALHYSGMSAFCRHCLVQALPYAGTFMKYLLQALTLKTPFKWRRFPGLLMRNRISHAAHHSVTSAGGPHCHLMTKLLPLKAGQLMSVNTQVRRLRTPHKSNSRLCKDPVQKGTFMKYLLQALTLKTPLSEDDSRRLPAYVVRRLRTPHKSNQDCAISIYTKHQNRANDSCIQSEFH